MTNDEVLKALIEKEIFTTDGVEKAKAASTEGASIWDKLTEIENVDSGILLEQIAAITGYVPIRPWRLQPDMDLKDLIPSSFANENFCAPLCKIGNIITLAFVEPWNEEKMEEIRSLLGERHVTPVLCTVEDIRSVLESMYGDNYQSELKSVLDGMEDKTVEYLESGQIEEAGLDKSILLSLTDQEPVVRLVNSLLKEGVNRKASDIFIEPGSNDLRVRFRVDGIVQDGPHPPKSMRQGVLSRLKIMSNLDIAEQRLPQDGRVRINMDNRNIEFRLSTIPTFFGEKACLRILDPGELNLSLAGLGYSKSDFVRIESAIKNPFGMILICGPTGSGKSTTMYSMLKYMDGIEKNLVTVEDPVEFHMEGLNQVNVKSEAGMDFAAALRSILRQDPDVIMIGEIRDLETMNIGIKAALTGHMVLSTLHTNSASGSITRLMNMGIEPFLITASLLMVGSQRLLRKLCMKCREETNLDLKQARAAGLPNGINEVKAYKSKGCPDCNQTGYKGRVSVSEILLITAEMRKLIMKHATEGEVKKLAREEGMTTLRESAMMRVADGTTALDEALRVSVKDEALE